MRASRDHVAGVAVVVALVVVLAGGMNEPPDGLSAHVDALGPYLIAPQPQAMDLRSHVAVGPPELLPRLASRPWGVAAMGLTTWEVGYGHRWRRAVTIPVMRGPLVPSEEPICGISARISPGVLDPKQAGGGLLSLVRAELEKVLPLSLPCGFSKTVYLSAPKTVSLDMTPQSDGVIRIKAVATLSDGTMVGAGSAIRLVASAEGDLVVEQVAPVEPLFAGPGRAACEGTLMVKLGNLWWRYIKGQSGSLVLAAARAEMTRHVSPALAALNTSLTELTKPFTPFRDEPHEVRLRLARPPEVSEAGIGLRLCATVKLGGELVNPAITGPPRVRSPSPAIPRAAPGPRIDVAMNAETVSRIVYMLWQTGQLRAWGTSAEILDQLPDEVKSLAFDVRGFDPMLPPVIADDRVVAANIAVGTWGDRRVFGHATGALTLDDRHGEVVMTATVAEMAVNCAAPDGNGWRLTPCLSELLPMVQEQLSERPPELNIDSSALVRAMADRTVHGMRLKVSPPAVRWERGILSASMSVEVGQRRR